MIALIALLALALAIGAVIGFVALLVAIVKTIVRALRRHPHRRTVNAPVEHTVYETAEDEEFLRIMREEWPGQ